MPLPHAIFICIVQFMFSVPYLFIDLVFSTEFCFGFAYPSAHQQKANRLVDHDPRLSATFMIRRTLHCHRADHLLLNMHPITSGGQPHGSWYTLMRDQKPVYRYLPSILPLALFFFGPNNTMLLASRIHIHMSPIRYSHTCGMIQMRLLYWLFSFGVVR